MASYGLLDLPSKAQYRNASSSTRNAASCCSYGFRGFVAPGIPSPFKARRAGQGIAIAFVDRGFLLCPCTRHWAVSVQGRSSASQVEAHTIASELGGKFFVPRFDYQAVKLNSASVESSEKGFCEERARSRSTCDAPQPRGCRRGPRLAASELAWCLKFQAPLRSQTPAKGEWPTASRGAGGSSSVRGLTPCQPTTSCILQHIASDPNQAQ